MRFNRRHNSITDTIVFQIPEHIWYAAKLRLYLTSGGANTNIDEDGFVVEVRIDHKTTIKCHSMGSQHSSPVKIVTSENNSHDQGNVKTLGTFDQVLEYIRFMKLLAGSRMTSHEKHREFMRQLNAPTPPTLVSNWNGHPYS